MQQASIQSAFISGTDVVFVDVEANIELGMPGFTIIGIDGGYACETAEKVRCAVKSSGFGWPRGRITVNIGPTHVKKRGFSFDLAIATAILVASGQVSPNRFENTLVVGELSLDGTVLPGIRGFVAYALEAKAFGMALCTSPFQGRVGSYMPDAEVDCLDKLSGLRDGKCSKLIALTNTEGVDTEAQHGMESFAFDLEQIAQERSGMLLMTNDADRAFQMAKCILSAMAPASEEERAEIACVHSCADVIFEGVRPLRAPHHSVTLSGLIGGGMPVFPGEISLAHGGVLFLQDLEEFSPSSVSAIEATRKSREVAIVRADGRVTMPADCTIVATAKPCPCGRFGDPRHECTCSSNSVLTYQRRLEQSADRLGIPVVSY